MRPSNLLRILIALCFATTMRAQTSAPKPSPELKKLLPLVGHWTYEEEWKAGPLGPRWQDDRRI